LPHAAHAGADIDAHALAWAPPPADPAAITGHAPLLKRFNSPSGMKRVIEA
jgi:hypothetical protein